MIAIVICVLTALLTVVPALVGAAIGYLMKAVGQDSMVILFVGAMTVSVFVQHCFRRRTRGRVALFLWYSFDRSVSLAGGSGFSFVAGYLFGVGWLLTSGIVGALGLFIVAYMCIEGPSYGWDEFIPPHKQLQRGPKAGRPFEGY